MGRVHVIGILRNLCNAVIEAGSPSIDAGPLLGSPAGGPFVDASAVRAALDLAPAMTVLIRDNGSNVEVCTPEGEVLASVPTI